MLLRPNTRLKYSLTKYIYKKNIYRMTGWSLRHFETHSKPSTTLHSSCIRQTFIDYFKNKHSHIFVPSSSTIPSNDATLLFTNAGMNQFKDIFQGTVHLDSRMSKYRRVVNSQKCVRAGGKHNDLDEVGQDCYHHTFFEMLGNWSFADYFKKDAIHMAWDLLTNVYKMPKDRLYVTYFLGNDTENLQADLETKEIWHQLGLPENRVLPFSNSENFWEMGNTGPCGPCTEIHFDRRGDRDASELVNKDDPEVVELWNLVFTQYDRNGQGELQKLPKNNVDTGMGLERLVSILQGVYSNYDTDLFHPIISAIEQVSGIGPYCGKVGLDDVDGVDMAYRVLADHARMLTVCITDGARPSPQMQGYLVKRILRRAVRYAREKLNTPTGTLASLVPIVVESLGGAFPELKSNPESVMQVINQEEKQFLKTLTKGQKYLKKHISNLGSQKNLSGKVAWKMYNSFGYPIDLTNIIAKENNLTINLEEYEEERRKSKEITAQGGIKNQQKMRKIALSGQDIETLRKQKVPVTNTISVYETKYNPLTNKHIISDVKTEILAIKTGDEFVTEVDEGVECGIITTSTSFYTEAGGQVADVGIVLNNQSNTCLDVSDVQSYSGYVLHSGKSNTTMKVADEVTFQVDSDHRTKVMRNHSATHLLNFALQKVIPDTSQKGSLVASDKLRFDFSAMDPLSMNDLQRISDIVNNLIQEALPQDTSHVPLNTAYTIPNLQAAFGEAYGDDVRVVTFGKKVNELLSGNCAGQSSVELCGGTHVENTSEIKKFIITSQKASSSGVRRLEAVTGELAEEIECNGNKRKEEVEQMQNKVSASLHNSVVDSPRLLQELDSLAKSVDKTLMCLVSKMELRQEILECKEKVNKAIKKSFKLQVDEFARQIVQSIDSNRPKRYYIHQLSDIINDKRLLKEIVNKVSKQRPDIAVMLLSVDNENIHCFSVVPKELNKAVKADEWGLVINRVINGKGSGSESSSQFHGQLKVPITEIVTAAEDFISSKVD
ncbi:alanine--tRNA ligase, cytoplasmic-like [Antedon mediterranea]|uniref:alanine--tRNA ligase, cytoplasmic-like n=1 Tax=Antedon mediterranea TaxID=105859 RepID=UPI003AF42643